MIRLFFERYGITAKIFTSDFFSYESRFKDLATNRFISRDEAMQLLQREPERLEHIILKRAKVDLPEFNLRKGQFVSRDIENELFNYLNLHNTAVGISELSGVDLDTAFDCVEDVYSRYVQGQIAKDEWSDALEECLAFPPTI